MKHLFRSPRNFNCLGVGLSLSRALIKKGECLVLMFHRVVEDAERNEILDPYIVISADNFRKIMRWVKNFFTIVDLYEWITEPIETKKCCTITFDDGWKDNYDNAYPILRYMGIPATIFLSVDNICNNSMLWFEQLQRLVNSVYFDEIKDVLSKNSFLSDNVIQAPDKHSLYQRMVEELKQYHYQEILEFVRYVTDKFPCQVVSERTLLNWPEIQEMSQSGISFGSHCVNHAILTKLSIEEKRYQLCKSYELLKHKDRKIKFVPIVSFPNGDFDSEVVNLTKLCGYQAMLSASIHIPPIREAKCVISRIGISDVTSGPALLKRILIARRRGRILSSKVAQKGDVVKRG